MKRTPLKPGKPLERRTALTVDPEQVRAWQDRSRRKAVERHRARPLPEPKPRKRKPRKLTGESAAKRLVVERSGGLCEVRVNGLCARWAKDFSHRVAEGQGGPWTASNGLHACRWCHTAITNTSGHRDLYVANGWILDRHHNPDGRLVLLAAYDGALLEDPVVALLSRDGRVVVIDEYAAQPSHSLPRERTAS